MGGKKTKLNNINKKRIEDMCVKIEGQCVHQLYYKSTIILTSTIKMVQIEMGRYTNKIKYFYYSYFTHLIFILMCLCQLVSVSCCKISPFYL